MQNKKNEVKTKTESQDVRDLLKEVRKRANQAKLDAILTKKLNNIELTSKEKYIYELLIDNDEYNI